MRTIIKLLAATAAALHGTRYTFGSGHAREFSGDTATARCSGDISSWARTQYGQPAKAYAFTYDGAHRLTAGQFYNNGTSPGKDRFFGQPLLFWLGVARYFREIRARCKNGLKCCRGYDDVMDNHITDHLGNVRAILVCNTIENIFSDAKNQFSRPPRR